jgi:predicted Zn-dependent protease
VAGASALVGAGDGAGAIALLGSLPTDSGMAEPVQRRARLALAQARYLVALRDPTAVPAATSAVESLVVMGRSDPAIAQVRAMVADLAGNRGEQARAWALMDESQRSGAALARVLDTQVALGIAQKLPVSELVPLAERARRADPQSPDTHLWLAWVHLVGHNAPQAVDVLRTSVQQVDGQVERRGPDAGVLRSPPEPGALLAALEEAVGNDATFGHAYHVSRATVHWLVGSPNSARKELEDAGDIDNDLDALALSARLRMAQKDNAGAILQWERITRERPKQGEYLLGYLQALVAAGRAAEGAQWVDTLSSSPLGSAMVPVIRAEIRVATGESAAAQRDLLDAIARDPLDVRSRIRYRKLALDSK